MNFPANPICIGDKVSTPGGEPIGVVSAIRKGFGPGCDWSVVEIDGNGEMSCFGLMVTRYAITHVGNDGNRHLTRGNQWGHYRTAEEAESWLSAAMAVNSPKLLKEVYGPEALTTFRVQAVLCYSHGDAVASVYPRNP